MDADHDRRIAEARAALLASDLPEGSWALDDLKDERCCLLRVGGKWFGGYFERGSFNVSFDEFNTTVAVERFVRFAAPRA